MSEPNDRPDEAFDEQDCRPPSEMNEALKPELQRLKDEYEKRFGPKPT